MEQLIGAPVTITEAAELKTGASYSTQTWQSALIVAAAIAILWGYVQWARPRRGRLTRGGLLTGRDNRRSTSKTIAWAWTVIVGWMVVTLALIANIDGLTYPRPQDGSAAAPVTLSSLLTPPPLLYLVLLGGPYAAAAFALASTQSKVATGQLTKQPSEAPSAADLIADDDGNIDLYDTQYVLFNVLAIVIVVTAFFHQPGTGLPEIPEFLAILTGGAALTYSVNKAVASDTPRITKIKPETARLGAEVRISGVQLTSRTGGALPTVTIGSQSCATPTSPEQDLLVVTVPKPNPGATPLHGTVDIVVSPTGALPIVGSQILTIPDEKPVLRNVFIGPTEQLLGKGSIITVEGSMLLDIGTPEAEAKDVTAIGGLTAEFTVNDARWEVRFRGPYSDTKVTLAVTADPPERPRGNEKLLLKLTRAGMTTEYERTYVIDNDTARITDITQRTARTDQEVTITGVRLTSKVAGGAPPSVTMNGLECPNVRVTNENALVVKIPEAPPGTNPLRGEVEVVVSLPGTAPIFGTGMLTAQLDTPVVKAVSVGPAGQPLDMGSTITVNGECLLDLGEVPGDTGNGAPTVGGLTATLAVAASNTPWPVQFKGPYSNDAVTLTVTEHAPAGVKDGDELQLTLTRSGKSEIFRILYRADP